MRSPRSTIFTAAAMATLGAAGSAARANDYSEVVAKTAGMVSDPAVQALARKHGLEVLNVTWEDTGRFKGSCVGPNISDLTIQVQQKDPTTGEYRLSCMPVIRFPNFEDKTGDLPLDHFKLLAGNERGRSLEPVTLTEYLGNLRRYLARPLSWKGAGTSLLAERDTRVLVSAQACFLPIPREGKAEFNPVLFNYQSFKANPAVLSIVVTREGTSATVIDNTRDAFPSGFSWGQRLFFNQKGERAVLSAERLSDYTDRVQAQQRREGQPVTADPPAESPLDMVLLIQIPLKQAPNTRRALAMDDCCEEKCAPCCPKAERSDVEAAVVGHGKVEGPFTEIDDLAIERDPSFPVRVTVQFYKATSNGVVSEEDMSSLAAQIRSVYDKAESVGSLVTRGETGRPTEYTGNKQEYPGWWGEFWTRHEKNTGLSREKTIEQLRRVFGPDWRPASDSELARGVDVLGGGKPVSTAQVSMRGSEATVAATPVVTTPVFLTPTVATPAEVGEAPRRSRDSCLGTALAGCVIALVFLRARAVA